MVNRMQKLLALLVLPGLAVFAGGCAAVTALPVASLLSSPNASALEIHSHTEIRLQEANFIVAKTNVVGQSGGFSLLGIVTIVPANFGKAMSRVYANAEMQPGRSQTLANLVMEKNSSYFILFSLPRVSIRADVIEFVSETRTNTTLPPLPPDQPKP
jgi:hypothetical protein